MEDKEKSVPLQSKYRGMEQLVARWAHNPKVIGSSPVPATQKAIEIRLLFFGCFFISDKSSAKYSNQSIQQLFQLLK